MTVKKKADVISLFLFFNRLVHTILPEIGLHNNNNLNNNNALPL